MTPAGPPDRQTVRATGSIRRPPSFVDGGAVAAGLIVCIGAILITIAGPMPVWLRLSVTAVAVIVGAIVSGALTEAGFRTAVRHGILVVAATVLLMGLVGISIEAVDGDLARVSLFYLYLSLSTVPFTIVVLTSLAVGAIAGVIGHGLRPAKSG